VVLKSLICTRKPCSCILSWFVPQIIGLGLELILRLHVADKVKNYHNFNKFYGCIILTMTSPKQSEKETTLLLLIQAQMEKTQLPHLAGIIDAKYIRTTKWNLVG